MYLECDLDFEIVKCIRNCESMYGVLIYLSEEEGIISMVVVAKDASFYNSVELCNSEVTKERLMINMRKYMRQHYRKEPG